MEITASVYALGDMALAMALGGVVGFEREMKNRPAGFRTHMLVAGAAALLVAVGRLMIADPAILTHPDIAVDPLRLVEAVIAGVSFIGAGTIFASRHGASAIGITTAASLLMVAIIGVCVAFSFHALAFGATAMTMLVLGALNMIEARHSSRSVAAPEEVSRSSDAE